LKDEDEQDSLVAATIILVGILGHYIANIDICARTFGKFTNTCARVQHKAIEPE
jgi:hypothetical protein